MTREPVAIAGAVAAIVAPVVGLAVAFGVHVTDVQMAAIDAVVGAIVSAVGVLFARARVTPLRPLPPPLPPAR